MPSELTTREAKQQAVAQQSASQGARNVETQEHSSKASASAGLNLNLFGALSGALSSKSKTVTHENGDGSKTSIEDRHDKAAANGLAHAQGTAHAAAAAEESGKKSKSRSIEQSATQTNAVAGSKKVDHLGLEG